MAVVVVVFSDVIDHSAARSGLETTLTDPASAQFRRVDRHGANLCGFVNARNLMGGYVGFQRFIVRKDGPPLLEKPDYDGPFTIEWLRRCPGQGSLSDVGTEGRYGPSMPN